MIQAKRNECMNLVRVSNRKINEIRSSDGESPEHIAKKKEICAALKEAGKHYVTEAIFKTGGRADILVLDDFEVIEIVNTENEESLIRKSELYPKGLKIRVIKLKNKKGGQHGKRFRL